MEKKQRQTSEVIYVNFRTGEITKSVETDIETGEVVSSFEVIEKPTPFMGEGFAQIVDILLRKNNKEGA